MYEPNNLEISRHFVNILTNKHDFDDRQYFRRIGLNPEPRIFRDYLIICMSPMLPDFTDEQKELLQKNFLKNPEIYLGRSFLLNRWIKKKRDRNTIIKTLKKLKTMGNPGKEAAKEFILRILNANVKSQLENIYIEYEYLREPKFYIELISHLIDLNKCLNCFNDSFKEEIHKKLSYCQHFMHTRINCLPIVKKQWCHFSFKNILHSEDYLNLIKAIELCYKLEGEYIKKSYEALEWILDRAKTYLDKICLKELLNCFLKYFPDKPTIVVEAFQALLSNKDITVAEFESYRNKFLKYVSKVNLDFATPYIDFNNDSPKLEIKEYIRRAETLMNLHSAFYRDAWNYLYLCVKNYSIEEIGQSNINIINDLMSYVFMAFDYSTKNSSVEDLFRLLDATSLTDMEENLMGNIFENRRKIYQAILNHKDITTEQIKLVKKLGINYQTRLI